MDEKTKTPNEGAPPSSNIIPLRTYRALQTLRLRVKPYRSRIEQMDKAGLLTELLHYDELTRANPHDISVTLRAEQLMEVLEERAELTELRELASEFRTKLRARLENHLAQTAP